MISPYVRRLRLARELIALRESAKFTHARLAKATGESAAKISRLENGHIRPRLDDVLKILDALGVTDGEQWTRLVTIAREAAERRPFSYQVSCCRQPHMPNDGSGCFASGRKQRLPASMSRALSS